MKHDCRSFRAALESALESPREGEPLESLSWNEHLLGCAECRALLESEEALETLLESLPAPKLPPRLARRVLARLRTAEHAREDALDRLLERAAQTQAPPGLSRRVLAGLESARAQPAEGAAEARLDALLERARAVETPGHLAQRVLAHVAEERALSRKRRPVFARASVRFALAAGLLAAFGLWAIWPAREEPARTRGLAQLPDGVDARMLEHIDVLEQWELLRRNDLDSLLSTLPRTDQLLLEMGSEEGVLGG
ncbi:MAG: hypothetical protein IPJ19_06520 [Planctomycetes bacterium]|nr:hypothetical protein [Planctomycetota bacterium]